MQLAKLSPIYHDQAKWQGQFAEHSGWQVVQWYIDICREHGVGKDNVPWLDDLYLDIVVWPSRETLLLDDDDLMDALQHGDIAQADYDLAWREANRLTRQIERNEFALLDLCLAHRQTLLQGSSKADHRS